MKCATASKLSSSALFEEQLAQSAGGPCNRSTAARGSGSAMPPRCAVPWRANFCDIYRHAETRILEVETRRAQTLRSAVSPVRQAPRTRPAVGTVTAPCSADDAYGVTRRPRSRIPLVVGMVARPADPGKPAARVQAARGGRFQPLAEQLAESAEEHLTSR